MAEETVEQRQKRMADFDYKNLEDLASRSAQQHPVYGELVNYLANTGGVPSISADLLPVGTSGQYDPMSGNVTVEALQRHDPSVLIHELTHAASARLNGQYRDLKRAGIENQFTEAYEKMFEIRKNSKGRYDSGLKDMVRNMAPEWMDKKGAYRGTQDELEAFGVGNAADRAAKKQLAPPHVDPTVATQFRILMDLANRFPAPEKTNKKKAGGKISMPDDYRPGGKVSLI